MANFEGDASIGPAVGTEPTIQVALEIDNYDLAGWTAFLPPYLYPPPPPLDGTDVQTKVTITVDGRSLSALATLDTNIDERLFLAGTEPFA
jgi:hypothetical protein